MAEPNDGGGGGANGGKVTVQISVDASGVMRITRQAQQELENLGASGNKAGAGMGKLGAKFGQVGYQLQDITVQLQAGTSAFTVIAQQVPQALGAFGAVGALTGTVVALAAAIGGVLYKSINQGVTALKDITNAMKFYDDVIAVNSNGVAALSDKYAQLAKANREVAELMKQQAELELANALAKIPAAVQDASDSVFSFTDQLAAGLGQSMVTAKGFNDLLKGLGVTATDYGTAIEQARAAGPAFNSSIMSMSGSVETLAEKLGISKQQAFEFLKQISTVGSSAKPTDDQLVALAKTTMGLNITTKEGKEWQEKYGGSLITIATSALTAEQKLAALKAMMDQVNTSAQTTLVETSKRELELSKMTGKAKAERQAYYKVVDAGMDPLSEEGKQVIANAGAVYTNTEATKAATKATNAAASEAKKLAGEHEKDAKILAQLRAEGDLTTASVEKRKIEQAGLRAEQRLSSAATQQERDEARQLGEANERAAQSIQKRTKAEQANKALGLLNAKAQTTINPDTGEAADPMAQVNQDIYNQQQAYLKMYTDGEISWEQYQKALSNLARIGAAERAAITKDEAKKQNDALSSLLGSTSEAFGAMADVIGNAAGKNSAAYAAMFAISKGFAVAQAMLNLQVAISNAMAQPWPANMAAVAQAVAAGGQVISAIGSIAYSGGRKAGGPVVGGSMYRVGEGNKPEIFKAANGNQYMIPGQNGRVIGNKDLGGGGGGQVINFNIQTTGGIDDATMARMAMMMKQVSLNTIKDQQRPGGQLARSR